MMQPPKKSSKLILTIFTLWIFLMLLFGAPGGSDGGFFGMIRGGFIGYYFLFSAFLLSSSRILAHTLFAALHASPPLPPPSSLKRQPPVAVLYCTRNDVYTPGIESCLSLNYANYHTFLLDDSDDPMKLQEVDRIVREHEGRLTLIRRPRPLLNHKAGNLNHALRLIHKEYQYFVVVDSDNMLSPDFLTQLLPYFGTHERTGFVVCDHEIYTDTGNGHAPVKAHSDTFYPDPFKFLKNTYGFVPFLGHNGIIKTDVWRETGGFPHLIAEDISFALNARALDYSGLFVPEVHCRDSMPDSSHAMWIRHARWLRGNWQFLFGFFPKFIFRGSIPFVEKVDSILSTLTFIIPWPFMILSLFILTDILVFTMSHPTNMSSIGALRHYLGFTGAGIVGLIGLELFLWRIASLGRAGGLELFKTVYIQLLFYPKLLLEYARAMLPRTKIAWTTSGENHTRSLRDTTLHIIIGLAFLFAGIGLRSPLLVLIGAVSATSFLTEYCSGARFTAFLVNAAGAGMAFVLLRFCYLTVGTCFFL